MSRLESVNTIINDAAIEVGLRQVEDAYSSQDEAFIQLRGLLVPAGRELTVLHEWSILERTFSLNTSTSSPATGTPPADGLYDLPTNFSRMIDQTGWNRDANLPIGGPMSAQVWSALVGRDLGSTTIYAQFRLAENKIQLYPAPAPEDTDLSFRYISRDWVVSTEGVYSDRPTSKTDTVLFDPILVVKLLKMKYLSLKGFDITVASREFDLMFNSRVGQDSGAPVLDTTGRGRGYPYLNPWRSLPDTGYGST